MKILVTGGAGFIGTNFINYALKRNSDYHIINIDNLSCSNTDCISSIKLYRLYNFIEEDILNKNKLEKIFIQENFDIVVNFAAESNVDNSIINPEHCMKTNILGTQNLLELSYKYKVKRFHQVSTDEVYGEISLDSDKKFNEDSLLNPGNPYSASKSSADLISLSFFKTYSLPITISRSCNNYGPYQFYDKLIPKIIMKALKNEKIPIYGNGENMRSWIYVEDNCRAIDMIIKSGLPGSIYNISTDFEISNIDLVKLILYKLGKPLSLIEFVPDRLGHDLKYSMDCTKIKIELDFSIKHDFSSAIDKTINWYLSKL